MNLLFVLPLQQIIGISNLFLGSVGSFPELVSEKLLHFHKVICKLQNP